MRYGVCKECLSDVPLEGLPDAPNVYECPACFHPHCIGEFCDVFEVNEPVYQRVVCESMTHLVVEE